MTCCGKCSVGCLACIRGKAGKKLLSSSPDASSCRLPRLADISFLWQASRPHPQCSGACNTSVSEACNKSLGTTRCQETKHYTVGNRLADLDACPIFTQPSWLSSCQLPQ